VSLSNRPSGTDWVGPAVLDQMVAASKTHGVALTSVCLNILHRNFLKSDPVGVQRVADSIDMAKRVGVQVILLPFFGKGALETPAEMDYVADLLKELGPQAEKQRVILGLENTISAKDNVRIMERSQSPAVKTYYDVGNSIKQGFDIIEEIRWLGNERICEIHLKDNPHYLGEGPINFPAVIKALVDIGFDKWAVLETSCPSDNVQADMTRNLAFIRTLIEARA
jgi:sugar phosphate isomerase/epimerase